MDKKEQAKLQQRFNLHVALIMESQALSKAKAVFLAWCEGGAGLDKRLGRPQLALWPAAVAPVFGVGPVGTPDDPAVQDGDKVVNLSAPVPAGVDIREHVDPGKTKK
jgi:hypothetical protein